MLSGGNLGKISSYQQSINKANERVQNEFATYASNCVDLDLDIKKIGDRIVSERLKPKQDSFFIKALEDKKVALEARFSSNNCSDKIEKSRQIETALLLTKEAIKSEESVLTKSNVEQNIYIGVGSLVLLVGLYIIVRK